MQMTEEERQQQHDRIRHLVELNGRLSDIDQEFSRLRNEFVEADNQGQFIAETEKVINRLKNDMFVTYIAADSTLNSQ